MSDTVEVKQHIFFNILLVLFFISIILSFYYFYYKKDYVFLVETRCNPETETCFYRDCEQNPDECPPNNMSYYNSYSIKARDFEQCLNEDCNDACQSAKIECIKNECTTEDIEDGACLIPSINQDFN